MESFALFSPFSFLLRKLHEKKKKKSAIKPLIEKKRLIKTSSVWIYYEAGSPRERKFKDEIFCLITNPFFHIKGDEKINRREKKVIL